MHLGDEGNLKTTLLSKTLGRRWKLDRDRANSGAIQALDLVFGNTLVLQVELNLFLTSHVKWNYRMCWFIRLCDTILLPCPGKGCSFQSPFKTCICYTSAFLLLLLPCFNSLSRPAVVERELLLSLARQKGAIMKKHLSTTSLAMRIL